MKLERLFPSFLQQLSWIQKQSAGIITNELLCLEIATSCRIDPLNPLKFIFSLNPLLKSPVSKVAPNVDGTDSANINQQAAKSEGWYSTTSTGTQTMPTIDIELR